MSRTILKLALVAALAVAGTAQARDLAGRYRLNEGHEAAGVLELRADHRFGYELAYGALDERARGRWAMRGERACLTTEPTPKPPEFKRLAPKPDQTSTVMVEAEHPGEGGEGVAGVDVVVGFDSGDPATGYTQYYGWSLDPGEQRQPRWVQLAEPIYRFTSPRYPLTPADHGRLRAAIVPNDIGVVDFRDACLESQGAGFVLHRAEGDMHFVRVKQ